MNLFFTAIIPTWKLWIFSVRFLSLFDPTNICVTKVCLRALGMKGGRGLADCEACCKEYTSAFLLLNFQKQFDKFNPSRCQKFLSADYILLFYAQRNENVCFLDPTSVVVPGMIAWSGAKDFPLLATQGVFLKKTLLRKQITFKHCFVGVES